MENRGSVDRGWAWIVLAACFLRAFLVIGINKAFGMFFVEYVEAFGSNSSMISAILAVQQVMFSVSSFCILTIGHRFFSFRPIIIFGSVFMAGGFFLNAMAPNVEFLLLSQGMLFGIGQAAASGPSVVVLNSYFDKRRGMANSLSNSGGSLGGLLLPLIIQILLETYDLRGAQIIMSAILLNIVVAGALMRPLKDNIPSEKLNLEVNVDNNGDSNGNNASVNFNGVDSSLSAEDIRVKHSKSLLEKTANTTNGGHKPLLSIQTNNQYRMRTFSENLHEHRQTSSGKTGVPHSADASNISKLSNIYGSLADVTSSIQSVFFAKSTDADLDLSDSENGSEKCVNKFCLDTINFKILKNHHLKFLYLVGFLAVYGCRLQLTYIPPYARDLGISSRNISYLVTIVGTCDFAGRFAIAWIADSKRIRRTNLIAVSLIITGSAAMFNQFITNFPTFAAYSVIYGLCGGLYNSLLPLLLVECVGAKNLSTALAFLIQIHGVSISSMAPVLGTIRDTTGSYSGPFYIMGAGMLLSAALLLFVEPIARKFEHERKKKYLSSQED